MENEDVVNIISLMNDYADKKNNQGLKNVLLIILISVVGSIATGVVGYGMVELGRLREENVDLRYEFARMKARADLEAREQNKATFALAEAIAEDDTTPEKDPTTILKKPDDDDESFRKYHENFEQRIQKRLPLEQRTIGR